MPQRPLPPWFATALDAGLRGALLAGLLAGEVHAGPAKKAPPRRPDVLSLRRPAGPEWFGLYLLGKKAGYTRSELRRAVEEGVPVLVATQDTQVSAMVGGTTVARTHRTEKAYAAAPGGRLLRFRSERSGDGGGRTVEGKCDARSCSVALRSSAGSEARTIPAPAETLEQADSYRLAAARRGAVSGFQLDLEELAEQRVTCRWKERRNIGGAGARLEVSVVVEQAEGEAQGSEVLVADDGRVLELRLSASLVARAEPEAVARRLDAVDLFGLTRVPLPRRLPTEVPMSIAYRLRGLPQALQAGLGAGASAGASAGAGAGAGAPRQRTQPLPGGDLLVTVTARPPAAARADRDALRTRPPSPADAALLEPSSSWLGRIDSDAPAIRSLAAEVVGGEPGAYAAALRLSRFVYGRLAKVLGQSHDRATEVLAAGAGDCTEHSLLLTALARAAGIAARPVYGLVQVVSPGGASALYWHAWVEVKSGEEWIAVDPTLGQDVADATHVALGRGPSADLVGMVGGLRVVTAEVRRTR